MDITNDIFELDVLYKKDAFKNLRDIDIYIYIPFSKFTYFPNRIPNDFSSTLRIKLIYNTQSVIILDCILNISINGVIYLFEFEYYWNFIINQYKFKNNFYKIDYFVNYIKDSMYPHNNIKLTGSIFNKLIFKSNYPILGNI